MKIFTHPNNKKYLDSIKERAKEQSEKEGYIPISVYGYEVIFSSVCPEYVDSKTDIIKAEHPFCEYSDTEWERFCGYVKPKKEVCFSMFDDRGSFIHTNFGPMKVI